MWTSSVLVEPNQFSSHTRAIRSSRVTTRPAWPISSASRSNSLRESWSSSPASRTRREPGSTSSSPTVTAAAGAAAASRRPRRAAQHRADARDHLGAAERLDDVVVGAELEPDDAVGLGPARGQHHDRDVAAAAQRAADVAAVAVGQREVEQDDVGLDLVRELERARRGGGHERLEALARERLGERAGDARLVLDEQHPAASAGRTSQANLATAAGDVGGFPKA